MTSRDAVCLPHRNSYNFASRAPQASTSSMVLASKAGKSISRPSATLCFNSVEASVVAELAMQVAAPVK